MIATNTLLSAAFSLIANFTNVVPVSDNAVPQSGADLQRYIVGSPGRPMDLFLWSRNGSRFEIQHGIVNYFESSDSYFNHQDPRRNARFAGDSILDSDQAVAIASNVLQRLLRTDDRLTNAPPRVTLGGFHEGKRIPFFLIRWPEIRQTTAEAADIEIDGRNGKVVHLALWDVAFFDLAYEQKMREEVYTDEPKPVKNLSTARSQLARPSSNYVTLAISNSLAFCSRVGLDPGSGTNIANVDWDHTWCYTDEVFSVSAQVAQIRFIDRSSFESLDGIVFSYFSHDACHIGFWMERPQEEWNRFRGKILVRWEDLARNLENVLVEKLGVPRTTLGVCTASPRYHAPDVGGTAIKRIIVDWRDAAHGAHRADWASRQSIPNLTAEFDLETGSFKSLKFYDPKFIEVLRQSQLNHR